MKKFFCQSLRVAPIKFGTDGWRAVIAEDFTFAGVASGGDAFLERVEFSFGRRINLVRRRR